MEKSQTQKSGKLLKLTARICFSFIFYIKNGKAKDLTKRNGQIILFLLFHLFQQFYQYNITMEKPLTTAEIDEKRKICPYCQVLSVILFQSKNIRMKGLIKMKVCVNCMEEMLLT